MDAYLSSEFWSSISASCIKIQGSHREEGKRPKLILESGDVIKISIDDKEEIITIMIHYSSEITKGVTENKIIQRTLNNCSEIRMENNKLYLYQENEPDIILTLDDIDFLLENLDFSQIMPIEPQTKSLLRYNDQDWNVVWEKMVVIRHGDYKKTEGGFKILSSIGRDEINKTSSLLEGKVSLVKAIVFSSTVPRAMESAILIANHHQIDWETQVCLGTFEGDNYSCYDTLSLLYTRHKKYQTIILVTHEPFCKNIGKFLNNELFDEAILPTESRFRTADAMVIDLKNRSYEFLKSGQ